MEMYSACIVSFVLAKIMIRINIDDIGLDSEIRDLYVSKRKSDDNFVSVVYGP